MLPEKLKIDIEKGKIINVVPSEIGVELKIDGKYEIYKDAFVLPGLIDSHLHFFGIGEVALMPDFRNCRNELEMIELIRQKPFKRGDWLVGFGWNQENFPNNKFPSKELFDKEFPDTPIFLKRIDGHTALVNSTALKLAQITKNAEAPEGGIIEKNSEGELTGILIDTAMDVIMNGLPFYSEEQIFNIFDFSQNYLINLGLTEVIDMDLDPRLIEFLKIFDETEKLKIHVNSFVKAHNDEYKDFIKTPYSGRKFSVKGIKLYADGAMGSYGAAFKSSYSDKEGEFGLLLLDKIKMKEKIINAANNGFATAVHSIGDRGAELTLDVFNEILSGDSAKIIQKNYEKTKEIPFRLEHCQVLSESELSKFSNGLIAASVQPIHFVSDTASGMASKRLGEERMKDAYRWKSLLQAGGLILGGSDAPIESPNPFFGIDAFINKNKPEERLNLSEAINAYSLNPSKSLGNNLRGSIQAGNEANLVIVSKDIADDQKVKNTKVLRTIIS